MKVIHLTTVDMSLRFLVFPQLKAIREASWEPIGVSASGPWVPELESAGVRHIELPASTRGMNLAGDFRAARQLWRILRRVEPDILHTHNPKPGLYGRVVGRLAGVPIVINTVHGLYATEDDSFVKRLLVYVLEAIAARFSDAELVQNPEDLRFMRRWRITPRGRARLLGNGVDLDRFDRSRAAPDRVSALRQELGASEDQVVIGIVGRLVAEKGYPELFEAHRALSDRYVLVVIGPHDPDKSDALDPKVIQAAEDQGVRFLGMRDDVVDLYAAMDIFVLPSHREGFPRAAMEAAAMGLPIVATDIRGCRQIIDHGVNGLLIPVKSATDLARALRDIGDDEPLRTRMGSASREKAAAEFDERKVVRIVMETYREVVLDKGMVDLIASNERPNVDIRVASSADAKAVARLHATSIDTGFLPRLGLRFLRQLYEVMVDHSEAVVMVADDGSQVVGFVAGVTDTGAFYSHFLRRRGLAATAAAFPRLLKPGNIKRALETLRYGGGEEVVSAELVSMAVVPQRRGEGLGQRLGVRLLEELNRRQAGRVRVVVGSGNERAIAAYRRMGFQDAETIELHAGERSAVLVWSPPDHQPA